MKRDFRKFPDLPPLTESQAEILEILWDQGESTVSSVWKALRQRRVVARNTVHTMMTRLVANDETSE